jgi:hypothetical protein
MVLVTWTVDGCVTVRVSSIVMKDVTVAVIVFSWVLSTAIVIVAIDGESVAITVIVEVEVLDMLASQ